MLGGFDDMNTYHSPKPVAKFRLIYYLLLIAAASIAARGYFQHDPKLCVIALIIAACSIVRLEFTLAVSVLAEVAFVQVGYLCFCFGMQHLHSWEMQVSASFHWPATWAMLHLFGSGAVGFWKDVIWDLFVFLVAVLQWWLIILAAIWMFRHFRQKYDHAA